MPQVGHDLIVKIPRLETVARIVLYQNKHFDDVLIIMAGTRVSPLLLDRLKNFATLRGLKEPI